MRRNKIVKAIKDESLVNEIKDKFKDFSVLLDKLDYDDDTSRIMERYKSELIQLINKVNKNNVEEVLEDVKDIAEEVVEIADVDNSEENQINDIIDDSEDIVEEINDEDYIFDLFDNCTFNEDVIFNEDVVLRNIEYYFPSDFDHLNGCLKRVFNNLETFYKKYNTREKIKNWIDETYDTFINDYLTTIIERNGDFFQRVDEYECYREDKEELIKKEIVKQIREHVSDDKIKNIIVDAIVDESKKYVGEDIEQKENNDIIQYLEEYIDKYHISGQQKEIVDMLLDLCKNGNGIRYNLEQIKLAMNPNFDGDQTDKVLTGFNYGLSMEQVKRYAKPQYGYLRMNAMLDLFNDSYYSDSDKEKIFKIYANLNLSDEQVSQIWALNEGLTVQEIETVAKPDIDPMKIYSIICDFGLGMSIKEVKQKYDL